MANHRAENEPMRILHIMSGFGGGISSFIKNQAEGLVNRAIIFDVVTYDECSPAFMNAIEAIGGNVYRLVNPKKDGWKAFRQSFINVLQQNTYDVVHCHISGYRALPYRYLARSYHIKKFYIHAHLTSLTNNHSIKYRIQTRLYQLINQMLSDAYLGCSKEAIYSVFGQDIPENQIMVIPNSIDSFQFIEVDEKASDLRISQRETYQFDLDDLVIGQVARLETVKNHQFTLRLAHYMEENNLAGKFVLVGEGSLKDELSAEIKRLNLQQRVFILGRIHPITEFYPMLDVLFLPSLREGLPTVVVEAQASGIPVVMADTITQEVDLHLGMVQAVALDDSLANWYQAIVKASQTQVPSMQKRLNRIKAENFTNESAARLYEQFLRGKITSYQIGQSGGYE